MRSCDRWITSLIGAAWLLLIASQASAGVCWRGKPFPECHTFILTDLGVYARLDDDPTQAANQSIFFTLDLGLMKNVSPTTSIGGTFYGGSGDSHARVGGRFRYRRWLSRNFAFDVAPGLIVYGSEDGGYTHQFPGLVLGTSLNWRDWVALGLEVEHSRYRIEGFTPVENVSDHLSDTTWRLGGKLGSAPGLLGTAALVGFFIILVSNIEN